jgi:hypothetical protein
MPGSVCSESQNISHVFCEAVQTLWPGGVKFDVLWLVTIAVLYMKKAKDFH